MGTISDKLMRVINTKEDIRQALISKGYDVPTSIPFKEYAKMILDLPCNANSFPDIEGIVARYSALGLTNEQMAENPVWKDLTGNGHDLQMKNFAWGGMSGVGGYVDNWNSSADWGVNNYWVNSHTDHKLQFITASTVVQVKSKNIYNAENVYKNILKVNGLTEAVNKGSARGLRISATDSITSKEIKTFSFDTDGVIQISFDDVLQDYYVNYFVNGNNTNDIDITIEQLPLYPGFILGDGVDDFAVTEKELNFEDTYTVYTAFIPFQNNPTRNMILCGADSKKNFSMQYSSLVYVSFMAGNNYYVNADFVNGLNLFACKRNGNNICIKNLLTNKVVTGTCGDWVENAGLYYLWKNATYASFARAAIAGQTICNGYFSTDEDDEKVLDWYKKQYPWLFPDQAWTVTGKTNEDEDRATIANITGNGNDLVLSNFAFSGNSGYGEYAYNFNDTSWISIPDYGVISDKTSKSFNIKSFVLADYPVLYTAVNKDSSIKKVKIKVTNSIPGFYFGNKPANQIIDLSTDGIYEIPSYNSPNDVTQYGFRCSNVNDSCNITIEQIPEYEGYLVTDGVDDKITSSAFEMGKDFTVVGEWRFIIDERKVAGLIKPPSFYLFNENNGLKLFINNTEKSSSLNTKSLKAICSDGRVYFDDWSEMLLSEEQPITSSSKDLSIGYNSTIYTQMAFKNLGIYNDQLLSKDDCIKAYNYLQTIKAK
jgi:hypothetical protein